MSHCYILHKFTQILFIFCSETDIKCVKIIDPGLRPAAISSMSVKDSEITYRWATDIRLESNELCERASSCAAIGREAAARLWNMMTLPHKIKAICHESRELRETMQMFVLNAWMKVKEKHKISMSTTHSGLKSSKRFSWSSSNRFSTIHVAYNLSNICERASMSVVYFSFWWKNAFCDSCLIDGHDLQPETLYRTFLKGTVQSKMYENIPSLFTVIVRKRTALTFCSIF